jgi:hypothetical protein
VDSAPPPARSWEPATPTGHGAPADWRLRAGASGGSGGRNSLLASAVRDRLGLNQGQRPAGTDAVGLRRRPSAARLYSKAPPPATVMSVAPAIPAAAVGLTSVTVPKLLMLYWLIVPLPVLAR